MELVHERNGLRADVVVAEKMNDRMDTSCATFCCGDVVCPAVCCGDAGWVKRCSPAVMTSDGAADVAPMSKAADVPATT